MCPPHVDGGKHQVPQDRRRVNNGIGGSGDDAVPDLTFAVVSPAIGRSGEGHPARVVFAGTDRGEVNTALDQLYAGVPSTPAVDIPGGGHAASVQLSDGDRRERRCTRHRRWTHIAGEAATHVSGWCSKIAAEVDPPAVCLTTIVEAASEEAPRTDQSESNRPRELDGLGEVSKGRSELAELVVPPTVHFAGIGSTAIHSVAEGHLGKDGVLRRSDAVWPHMARRRCQDCRTDQAGTCRWRPSSRVLSLRSGRQE